MLESLEHGELVVFERPIKLTSTTTQSVRAKTPGGGAFGSVAIVVDWDRRIVWIEKKTDSWVWVPFERLAYGTGAGPTAPQKPAVKK